MNELLYQLKATIAAGRFDKTYELMKTAERELPAPHRLKENPLSEKLLRFYRQRERLVNEDADGS